jgi:hypothetical protein
LILQFFTPTSLKNYHEIQTRLQVKYFENWVPVLASCFFLYFGYSWPRHHRLSWTVQKMQRKRSFEGTPLEFGEKLWKGEISTAQYVSKSVTVKSQDVMKTLLGLQVIEDGVAFLSSMVCL